MMNPEDVVIDMSMDILNMMDKTHLIDDYEVAIKLNEIQLTRIDDGALFKITVEAVESFIGEKKL